MVLMDDAHERDVIGMANLSIRAGGMDRDEFHTLTIKPFHNEMNEPPINHDLQAEFMTEFLVQYVPIATLQKVSEILKNRI
jgi:hypothetical protein